MIKNNQNGVGTQLIEQIELYALKNNLSEIHVGTQLNNIKAQNFYIKCGFKHINNNSVYHWWIKGEE